jgi:hypothetical protein
MHIKTFSIKGFLILCLLAGLTTFLLTSFSFARKPIRTVTGTVSKVSDGDTIHVTTPEKTKLTVRLYGMDAPETPKTNQRTAAISTSQVNPMEKSLGRHWKPKSWGSRSDWISSTLTGINAWWE